MEPLPQFGFPRTDRGLIRAMLMWKPETATGFTRRLPTDCYGCIQKRNGFRGQLHQESQNKAALDVRELVNQQRCASRVRIRALGRTEAHQPDRMGACQFGTCGTTPRTMRYIVRMNYSLSVEGVSPSDAESKVASLIRKEPHLAIRGVDSKYKNMSIWRMFLFG